MREGVAGSLTVAWLVLVGLGPLAAAEQETTVPRFALMKSGLDITRPAHGGRFFDVVGRRAVALGYEGGGLEAWVYPLKVLDDFRLSFRLADYPLDIEGPEVLSTVSVRPEATIFTYTHAAFTVRQIVFAPLDEPGILMLLDVDSVLPLTVTGSFHPRLRLMWPAGLMTPNLEWDEKAQAYLLTEESKRFAAVVGAPGARDTSLMPYQEEPRDVPLRFVVQTTPETARKGFVPIAVAGSVEGREKAKATYGRLLASAPALYEATVHHYRRLQEETVRLSTPDPRLDEAFAWAKVGVDKGLATNPLLGTGMVAGFRTSGESERPGFAWFFGRDALWTALALDAYGEPASARTALEFLRRYQRADGKIPHEVSQSASLLPWFTDYPYPWNSADATPLYVIAHADHWRAFGDGTFLKASWESIQKAWRFSAATDTDGNGLIENTQFGHGWVEGGALHPAHEEIYLQGLWIQASRDLAAMAEAMGDGALAAQARAAAERTRAAVEQIYWLPARGFYAFATLRPKEKPARAEPGPKRERRQARLDELASARLLDEDTVLPAVPLLFGLLDPERAQSELDHLGGGAIATDWGARILTEESRLYDPLSYHYGSVWPLFTGWAAQGAYRYGRPLVGYQALMANALLGSAGALGYVTELLSGDFRTAFGRSSHHQVWSEAMVAAPLLRGLLGLSVDAPARALHFAPQLPADWDQVQVGNIAVGEARCDLALSRSAGRVGVTVSRQGGSALRVTVAPSFPLDARLRSATVNGAPARLVPRRVGDVQQAEVTVEGAPARAEIAFLYDEGTEVYLPAPEPEAGGRSEGLRVLSARPEGAALHLRVEGRGGRAYVLFVRTPRRVGPAAGVAVERAGRDWRVRLTLEGGGEAYARRDLVLPLGGAP